MRLLLDSNIVIPLVEEHMDALPHEISEALKTNENTVHASVAGLWEIAIKSRLGKLPLKTALAHLPEVLFLAGIDIISIRVAHVLAELEPVQTRAIPSTECCSASAKSRGCSSSR